MHRYCPPAFLFTILAFLVLNSRSDSAENNPPDQDVSIRVICPAIQEEESRQSNYMGENTATIELVVAGRVESVEKREDESPACTVRVERVLYGSTSEKTIRFPSYWDEENKELQFFSFQPALIHGDPEQAASFKYELRYPTPISEERAIEALAAVRLDYHVLSAKAIFIGKETTDMDEGVQKVEVIKPINGQSPGVGETVNIKIGDYLPRRQPMIYLVKSIDKEPVYQGGMMCYGQFPLEEASANDQSPLVYHITTRLPVECEPNVRAALARRDEYPIGDPHYDFYGEPIRDQEIFFRGSVEEAIDLLGSQSEPATILGARALTLNIDRAYDNILATIEREMYEQAEPCEKRFGKLKNMITMIARSERPTIEADLSRLIDKYIAHIATNPVEPPAVKRDNRRFYFYTESHFDDVNHSLSWLLLGLRSETIMKRYADRLLKLRDEACGRWKDEVQTALDALRIEDSIELTTAVERMCGTEPLRSPPVPATTDGRDIGCFTISSDGRLLATMNNAAYGNNGISVWNLPELTPRQTIDFPCARDFLFSSDSKFLYVAGSRKIGRIDLKTGRPDRTFNAPRPFYSTLSLSHDGQTLVASADASKNRYVYIWDVESGELVRTLLYTSSMYQSDRFHFAPKKKILLWKKPKKGDAADDDDHRPGWTSQVYSQEKYDTFMVSSADKYSTVTMLPFEKFPRVATFTPDERFLLTFEFRWNKETEKSTCYLCVREVDQGFRLVRSVKFSRYHDGMEFSADGKYLVLSHESGPSEVRSFPDFKLIKQFDAAFKYAAFSPCGEWMVATEKYLPVPRLIRTSDWTEVKPYVGHSDRLTHIRFSPDGKTVRTVDKQGELIHWNAETMKPIEQFCLPDGYRIISVRPSDGRYALTFLPKKTGSIISFNDPDTSKPARIVDLHTGKVASEFKESVHWNYNSTQVHWIADRELLISADGHWWRFDYIEGKVSASGEISCGEENELYNGCGEITKDGRSILYAGGDYRGGRLEAIRADVETMTSTQIGEIVPRRHWPKGGFGLVPDGKHFYIGSYIYDRQTLERVSFVDFGDERILAQAFSPDGSRYAVVIGTRIHVDFTDEGQLGFYDQQTKSIVRIHDTLTGRTLFTMPAPSRFSNRMTFSPDGRRLAIAGADGRIEVWPLPTAETAVSDKP